MSKARFEIVVYVDTELCKGGTTNMTTDDILDEWENIGESLGVEVVAKVYTEVE